MKLIFDLRQVTEKYREVQEYLYVVVVIDLGKAGDRVFIKAISNNRRNKGIYVASEYM